MVFDIFEIENGEAAQMVDGRQTVIMEKTI